MPVARRWPDRGDFFARWPLLMRRIRVAKQIAQACVAGDAPIDPGECFALALDLSVELCLANAIEQGCKRRARHEAVAHEVVAGQ